MNLNEVQIYLKQNNFVPSKKMGQNFLIDNNIAQNIMRAIDFTPFDLIVEIGPGLGAITEQLLFVNKPVIAIELDKRLFAHLKKKLSKIHLINDDILHVDWDKQFERSRAPIIVSNLPYSISSPVITKFLNCDKVQEMVCMLQKEMVDRLIAQPKTHSYNAFSVFIQSLTNINNVINVSKNCFFPSPEVDSVVIRIAKKHNNIDTKEYSVFLKQCFNSKRKTLANNLNSSTVGKKELLTFLDKNNLSPLVRAEELNIPTFLQLFNLWQRSR